MKVKLQEVLEALEGAGMETVYYYDTRNGEILMVFDGMINGEYNPELMEEISEGFIEDFIPLPEQYEIHEYRMMENFIYELPAGRNQDILEQAHFADLRTVYTMWVWKKSGTSTELPAMRA